MDFITAFLEGASTIIDSFGSLLADAAVSVSNIFYTPGAEGGLTVVGAAMAFTLVVGIVYLLFRMVRGLVKQNNRG